MEYTETELPGSPEGRAQGKFKALDRPGRAAMYKAAIDYYGIPMNMLYVDEAHDFLNRAGKQDSTMSKVMEAALDNHKYKALWTSGPTMWTLLNYNTDTTAHKWLALVRAAVKVNSP